MKISAIKNNEIKIIKKIAKQTKAIEWKPIKNYAQYLKEYGLK